MPPKCKEIWNCQQLVSADSAIYLSKKEKKIDNKIIANTAINKQKII